MTELVKLAQRGSAEAFARLIERNKQSLYKVARAYFSEPMDVDDAISETVLACWTSIRRLRQPENFRTWLIRILINKSNDMLAKRRGCVSLDELPEAAQPVCNDERIDFESLISLLDERYRPVIVLYYAEEMRIREISEATGLPEGTVSSHLRRGREQLARILRKDGTLK